MMWLLPDSPTTTWWLSDREKVIAVRRTQSNHSGMESKKFKMYQVVEAFTDPKTYLVFLINFCLNVPNGGTCELFGTNVYVAARGPCIACPRRVAVLPRLSCSAHVCL